MFRSDGSRTDRPPADALGLFGCDRRGVACADPGLPALFVSASVIGFSFMLFQIPTQHVTGSSATCRSRREFRLARAGVRAVGLSRPLVAGFAIDHLGFSWSFALLALIPIVPAVVLAGTTACPPGASARTRSRAARWTCCAIRRCVACSS